MLDSVSFSGNAKVPSAALEAVTKLRAGSTVSNETVAADAAAIQNVYKTKDVGVSIQPEATYPNHDNHVVLVWRIKEQGS